MAIQFFSLDFQSLNIDNLHGNKLVKGENIGQQKGRMEIQYEDQFLKGVLLDNLVYFSVEPSLDSSLISILWIMTKHAVWVVEVVFVFEIGINNILIP